MEMVLILWPFVLLLMFLVYGIYVHFKDRQSSSGLKLKVTQAGGKVSIRPLEGVFSKDSLVSGYVDDINKNTTFYSFVRNEYLVSVCYIDKFVGWVVTSTVIQIKSPVLDGMNIVVLSDRLPGYSQIHRRLRSRGADVVTADNLNRAELIKYYYFIKYLFNFREASKIDFYNGCMTIVVGNFLRSNILGYDQIDAVLNTFSESQAE